MVQSKSDSSEPKNSSSSTLENVAQSDDSAAESVDERKGIFIRLSPGAKRVLTDATSDKTPNTPTTYAGVIEALLEYYRIQSPDLKKKILMGLYVNPLKESETLVARLHRAQHAYENKRYYYAIKTYMEIAKSLEVPDSSKELVEVCNYRLGHCWIRLSYSLRRDALLAISSKPPRQEEKAKRDRLYNIALGVLDEARRFLARVKPDGDPLTRLISHYNRACCYALKAQYTVEMGLDPQDSLSEGLCDALKDTDEDTAKTLKVWEAIGRIWRGHGGRSDVDSPASNAFQELKEIYSADNNADSQPDLDSEKNWLVRMADKDSDLLFLRSDSEVWKLKFEKWVMKALERDNSTGKAEEDLLEESLRMFP